MPKFTVKLLKDLFRSNETRNRIAPVDGLRAVAVLGVIWAHVWAFGCGTPVWSLGKISSVNLDVNRAISAIGINCPKIRCKSSESAYWLRSFSCYSYSLFSASLPFFRSSLFPLQTIEISLIKHNLIID